VREVRAFARLQTGQDDGDEDLLPDGWLNVSGFIATAETLGDLKALPTELAADSPLARALLLDRDGVAADISYAKALEGAGVAVSVEGGDGWSKFASHPEQSELAPAISARMVSWLAEASHTTDVGESYGPVGTESLVLQDGVVESPLFVGRDSGRLFGVLTLPPDEPSHSMCAILLNAGAVRHVGPNRMWAETARRWAAAGVPTMRLDLESIGEADGDDWREHEIDDFYADKFVEQVIAVIDLLEDRGHGSTFILVGLCTGGYWAARTALKDPRVGVAVALNGGALTWHDHLAENRQALRLNRAFSLEWWRRRLRGGGRRPAIGELAAALRARLNAVGRSTHKRLTGAPMESSRFAADLDQLRERGTRLVLAFSADEGLDAELGEDGIWNRLHEWPGVARIDLPGRDHTLRSVGAQRAAVELLDAELSARLAIATTQSS
jgi:pimeloyl-ACP methyl ester carboxylesterase